jgi:hypothetical protein
MITSKHTDDYNAWRFYSHELYPTHEAALRARDNALFPDTITIFRLDMVGRKGVPMPTRIPDHTAYPISEGDRERIKCGVFGCGESADIGVRDKSMCFYYCIEHYQASVYVTGKHANEPDPPKLPTVEELQPLLDEGVVDHIYKHNGKIRVYTHVVINGQRCGKQYIALAKKDGTYRLVDAYDYDYREARKKEKEVAL